MTRVTPWSWLVPLICAALLSGCRSTGVPSDGVPGVGRTDEEMERRVKALAAFSTGILLSEREESEAAYEQFAKAAENDPGNEPLATDLARYYLQRNQPDQALAVLKRTASQPGSSGIIQSLLADILWRTGQTNAAIKAYEGALKSTPTLLGAYQQLAVIHLERKQTNQAWAVIERPLSLTQDQPVFWLNVADLFSWYGRTDPDHEESARTGMRQALDRAEGLKPSDPTDVLRLGRGFLELGENAKAEKLLEPLQAEQPRNPAVAANLAEALIRDGRLKEAREHLELLSRVNPTSHFPWYFLGVLDLEERKEEEAAKKFERTIQLNPEFEPAYSDLAAARLNQDDATAALMVLQQGLERFPTSFRLAYLTALAEARLKRFDKSLTAFRKAEAVAGDRKDELVDHRFYFQMGAMLTEMGREDESAEYMEKALALKPDFDEALNHLGYTWADQGKNLDRALDMIQRAVAAEPENPAYLDSLGWVLFKLGRPDEALPHLEKAAELLPEPDATVFDHLGDVLATLGRKEEAREAWQKSLTVETSEAVRKKLDGVP